MDDLDNLLTKVVGAVTLYEQNHKDSDGLAVENYIERIKELFARQVLIGRIETLENLKLYNGAYIGIDGKRVDNMVSHAVIDERIAELQSELARLERKGEARTGLSCHGKVLRPSRQQSHRAS